MVEFAGYDMPVEFSGIRDEHLAVRHHAGIFDVSHMGEIRVGGPRAAELVQYLTTNDISVLVPGQAQYACFPNGQGGIVDDLLVYFIAPNDYLLVVNASNTAKDWDWLSDNNRRFGANLRNDSDSISQLAVQGPDAVKIIAALTSEPVGTLPYYHFRFLTVGGVPDVLVSATGYTGAGGFELYVRNSDAIRLYNEIMNAGAPFKLQPIGLGARDTLRLEMGFTLYGNDIDDTTSPIEAGLSRFVKFTEANDFIDRPRLLAQKTDGVSRHLCGFVMQERGIPRHGYPLADSNGHVIGHVTSGTHSPILNNGIGMGYVNTGFEKNGTEIFVKIRDRLLKATVKKPPFI